MLLARCHFCPEPPNLNLQRYLTAARPPRMANAALGTMSPAPPTYLSLLFARVNENDSARGHERISPRAAISMTPGLILRFAPQLLEHSDPGSAGSQEIDNIPSSQPINPQL